MFLRFLRYIFFLHIMRPIRIILVITFAGVAQLVEQLIRNQEVGGSIPLSSTTKH